MTSVAFIGLGHMGAPMAGRQLPAGHHLTVWNRTPSRATALAERGAVAAGEPAEAAAGAVTDGLGRRDLAAVIPQVRGRTAASDAALEEVAR
jgi:3-hydroxyisobutyrate dehydrogenase-like beta-hydroxyacid dehydrogenase